MPEEKRERRKIVIYCDDVECYFKKNYRGDGILENECSLTLEQAIEFYKEHNCTTCEAGMGECPMSRDIMRQIKYHKYTKAANQKC